MGLISFLCAGPCSKHFAFVNPLNPQTSQLKRTAGEFPKGPQRRALGSCVLQIVPREGTIPAEESPPGRTTATAKGKGFPRVCGLLLPSSVGMQKCRTGRGAPFPPPPPGGWAVSRLHVRHRLENGDEQGSLRPEGFEVSRGVRQSTGHSTNKSRHPLVSLGLPSVTAPKALQA